MYGITSEMVKPLAEGIEGNIAAIMPIGIVIVAAIVGLAVVRIIAAHLLG